MALGGVVWEFRFPFAAPLAEPGPGQPWGAQDSLKHTGDEESHVLLQSAAALLCILLDPGRILWALLLEKAALVCRGFGSCWEEWCKKQQMKLEILMRYNLSQKVLIRTWFCLASFRAELQPKASLACAFVPLDIALSLSLSFFLS